MPAAARIGDPVSHVPVGPPTGTVGQGPGAPPMPGAAGAPMLGVASVRIGGRAAAVVGTVCACSVPPQHRLLLVGNVINPAPPSPRGIVLIGGFPAARQYDRITCGATIIMGAPNVRIGG